MIIAVGTLASSLNISEILASLLVERDVTTYNMQRSFSDLHSIHFTIHSLWMEWKPQLTV